MQTKPTLLAQPELTDAVGYLQRKAARDLKAARARLKRELEYLAKSAALQAERLDLEFEVDIGSIRNICDTRNLHEVAAELRLAESMVLTVAELIAPETEVGA